MLRVTTGARGTWHFLLVTALGRETLAQHGMRVDSAAIWYGRFDGRRWHGLSQIAVARDARLEPGEISELVVTPRGIAFAYSYDRSFTLKSNAQGNQGLVLLTRTGKAGSSDAWRSDTLPTWEGPQSVQLAPAVDGRILAVFNQAYFENHRLHRATLFSAVYDSAWQRPRIVWEPASGHVNEPLGVARVQGTGGSVRTVLSWEATAGVGTNVDSLSWGLVDVDGTIHRVAESMPLGSMFTRPSFTQAGKRGAVWIAPSDTARDELRLIYVRDATVEAIGTVHVPSFTPTPVAVTLADGTVLVATMSIRFAAGTAQPQSATTYLSTLEMRCSMSGASAR